MINDTNLFHVMMNPAIEELYECFVYQNQILHIPETSYTYKARNAIISTVPIENSKKIEPRSIYKEWFIKKNLFLKLSNSNDLFDFNYRWSEFTSNKSIVKKKEYSFLPQFRIQIINSNGELFLAIEPSIRLYSKLSLQFLKEKELINSLITPKHRCIVFVEKEDKRKWMSGVIHDINDETAKVEVPELFLGTIKVNLTRVIPRLGFEILGGIANTNIREEFNKSKLKFYSNQKEILENFYKDHLSPIFPLDIGNSKVLIKSQTIKLSELSQIQMSPKNATYFFVERNDQKVEGTKRLTTLSQISIRDNFIILPIVLFAPESELNFLDKVVMNLNDGIKKGNFKFSMTERFGVKLFVNDRFKTNNDKQYDDKINQFVNSIDKRHTDSLPIIYLSENSPLYYPIKAKLASYGKVSQVISKHNEDDIYSLWNLATNLYAKMGNTPWEIKEKGTEEQADLFLGFSSSSIKVEDKLSRNIGYVNVFDRNGVWKFTKSSTEFLDFDKRLSVIPKIITNAIDGFLASGEKIKVIDIHYSKKFSQKEREKCYKVIIEKIPEIKTVNFISINKTHPIRLFKKLPENTVISLAGNKILINTSSKPDHNRLFEITLWNLPESEITQEKLMTIYYRIKNLTLLNWRSVVDTTEPVTLKYSEEIAKLLNHFNLTEWSRINTHLSNIPWFI